MTLKEFNEKNYMILNGKIDNTEIYKNGEDKLFIRLFISGDGWSCGYGDFELTKEDYDGFKSLTSLMNTLDVDEVSQFKDRYVRVAVKDINSPVSIVGNIIFDKWYNFEDYFTTKTIKVPTDSDVEVVDNTEVEDDELDE